MSGCTLVTSLSNPRVKAVVKLRQQRERRRRGLLIAEGTRQVTRAMQAGLAVHELFYCPRLLQVADAGLVQELDAVAGLYEVTEPVMQKMAYLRQAEGLLAVVGQPSWTLDQLGPITAQTLVLVAVGTQKPGNLGAMVRTAAAAGCQAVLAAGAMVDVFNPNAIRNSTAAVFDLPTVSAPEQEVVDYLLEHHFRIMAATLDGAVSHSQAEWSGAMAVVIGPEDRGLDQRWRLAAEKSGGQCVAIAMHRGVVDSLNASAAAAVLLFEARRGDSGRLSR